MILQCMGLDRDICECHAGLYDAADTKRFYITVLNYELDQGVHLGSSQLLVAASVSDNPADGFLGPYAGRISCYIIACLVPGGRNGSCYALSLL